MRGYHELESGMKAERREWEMSRRWVGETEDDSNLAIEANDKDDAELDDDRDETIQSRRRVGYARGCVAKTR